MKKKVKDYDHIIDNNSTLEELKEKIITFFNINKIASDDE